jgi:hypothetical protein
VEISWCKMDRCFVHNDWRIMNDFGDNLNGYTRLTENQCVDKFGEHKWKEMLEEMTKFGYALLPDYYHSGIY